MSMKFRLIERSAAAFLTSFTWDITSKQISMFLPAMITDRIYLPFDEMRRAAYITPSSIVVAKLRAYENSESTRHLDDIASIVRLQGKKLDQARIDVAASRLGLLGVWRSQWEGNQRP
jgi:hypothetical protein